MAEVPEKKEHPRGVAGTIWALEHTQDLVSVVVGVLLALLAVVVLVLGVVDFVLMRRYAKPGGAPAKPTTEPTPAVTY